MKFLDRYRACLAYPIERGDHSFQVACHAGSQPSSACWNALPYRCDAAAATGRAITHQGIGQNDVSGPKEIPKLAEKSGIHLGLFRQPDAKLRIAPHDSEKIAPTRASGKPTPGVCLLM